MHRLWLSLALLASAAITFFVFASSPTQPTNVVRPPKVFAAEDNELLIWGAWQVEEGYATVGTGAVEIRCLKQPGVCIEAEANLLQHVEGQDLTAEAHLYTVRSWSADEVIAEQLSTLHDCANRTLSINLADESAAKSWKTKGDCAGTGKAILTGDAL